MSLDIDDFEFRSRVFKVTGVAYSFASSSSRIAGGKVEEGNFYQLMPVDQDNGFFDWYCSWRPNDQFFRTKVKTVSEFLKYWELWQIYLHLPGKITHFLEALRDANEFEKAGDLSLYEQIEKRHTSGEIEKFTEDELGLVLTMIERFEGAFKP